MFIAPLPPPFISIKENSEQELSVFESKDTISVPQPEQRPDSFEEISTSEPPPCSEREDRSLSLSGAGEDLRGRIGDVFPLSTNLREVHASLSRDNVARFSYQLRNEGVYKAKSSDFILDRLFHDASREASFKMSEIERGLFLGNNEAATDVLLLESKKISHIVTIDTVPLPRRILSILPKLTNLHLRLSDLPEEDILAHLQKINEFISVKENSSSNSNVLVHCYRGKSRSAAAVIAYIMQKYSISLEMAFAKVKRQRTVINPNPSFLAQLKLFENMKWSIDRSNVQFRMFKLRMTSDKMRKAKILFRDSLDSILDPMHTSSKNVIPPIIYKCKNCRITLASSLNLLPHLVDESPSWMDSSWSTHAEDVLKSFLHRSCSASVFINPVKWMEDDIKAKLSGKLKCPNCQIIVGGFSWIKGANCSGCKALIKPAFRLDITEIIFRTKCKFLQSNREPILV